jgi:hypothetical protein
MIPSAVGLVGLVGLLPTQLMRFGRKRVCKFRYSSRQLPLQPHQPHRASASWREARP